MKSDVVVPEVGESVSSGILASWLKEDGETVSEGDELFELETDKATLAVPAPADGVLSIQVAEDTEVQVGQTVGVVDSEGQAAAARAPAPPQPTPPPQPTTPARKPPGARARTTSTVFLRPCGASSPRTTSMSQQSPAAARAGAS